MGRWRAPLIVSRIISASKSINNLNFHKAPSLRSQNSPLISKPRDYLSNFRSFSALPSLSPLEEFDFKTHDFNQNQMLEEELLEDEEAGKIAVKAFFLCTSYLSLSISYHRETGRGAWGVSVDGWVGEGSPSRYFLSMKEIHGFGSVNLKSMQAENSKYVLPPTSRSSNCIALRFRGPPWQTEGAVGENMSCHRYMIVYQYGSAVLFNVEDHEVDFYLQAVKRHASGLLTEMRKDGCPELHIFHLPILLLLSSVAEYIFLDLLYPFYSTNSLGKFIFPMLLVASDYAIKEKPLLVEDMQGGPDYIVLKNLDTDSIRIIGSVLGQSIALDYFVSQVDGMVEEFAEINRGMEKTGTFTMDRKKLFQLVGKANSNLADVILKVGLFERSEIAWRDAKYAQILDYLREEYEVTQRFGNLDFKLKFVEHNIHFLQEVLQNRKSDLLEWCIIVLLSIENIISVSEIVRDSIGT
ncbi:hypothetical protein DH2020_047084 [Rehmannia glutinosa]|uniref:DUF155 domain-containing protein n=1 Tax=Rehmannia glutinosa TaxID=99300 RepID=A0ABR0U9A7_REHGL